MKLVSLYGDIDKMSIIDKGSVVFKHKPEDFIVEEIGEDGESCVSSSIDKFRNATVDLGKIDLNEKRTFLSFDLEKLNLDHFNAISILGQKIGSRPHEIGYAGTKDKIAWTSQRISVFNPDIEKIKKFSHEGIILKNFKWIKHKIKIGDLKGNRFKITLRDADKDAIKILNRVRNTENIPNYFGAQRFGSLRKDNFNIGKLILKKKFKEAVYAYLWGYGEKESEEVKKAKKRFKEEKDIISAKEYFPKELYAETKIIEYISKNKDDWIGALELLGERVLLIICQSVQSRVFDEILEEAITRQCIGYSDKIRIGGYDSEKREKRMIRIEEEVLKANDLKFEDFKMDAIPFLTLSSFKRSAFINMREMNVETLNDELFPPSKMIKLSFVLDSGCYATTLLEYFFNLREANKGFK